MLFKKENKKEMEMSRGELKALREAQGPAAVDTASPGLGYPATGGRSLEAASQGSYSRGSMGGSLPAGLSLAGCTPGKSAGGPVCKASVGTAQAERSGWPKTTDQEPSTHEEWERLGLSVICRHKQA